MRRLDLHAVSARVLGHDALFGHRDNVVSGADERPRRNSLPGRDSRWVIQCARRYRLLGGGEHGAFGGWQTVRKAPGEQVWLHVEISISCWCPRIGHRIEDG